jgi:UTP--glucose-1-phosphate uridylyltransferase
MIALSKNAPYYGFKFERQTYDCGSKLGFLTANVAYALDREDIAPAFRAELKKLLG